MWFRQFILCAVVIVVMGCGSSDKTKKTAEKKSGSKSKAAAKPKSSGKSKNETIKERIERDEAAISYYKNMKAELNQGIYKPGKDVYSVDFSKIKMTDADLVHLKDIMGLWKVSLEDTKVTDAGLVHMKGIKRLQQLGLNRTQITDAGLEHLKDIKTLRIIFVSFTKTTPAGIDKLRKALPKCDIKWTGK